MYLKNCMRKRNLILPFFVGSLFIPSLEPIQSATVFNVLENENITFQVIDEIPLASTSGATGGGGGGGGEGGGGTKSKQQKANLKKNKKKAQEAAKKRLIKSKIAANKPLTDEEKKIGAKEIINLFKAIKISLKNGNEALMQTQLKELLVDYGLGALTDDEGADGTDDNYLKLIEMGDEGIDLLIKTFESAITLLTAESKLAAGEVLTDEENYILFENKSNNAEDKLGKEINDYFKNNNINTKDKAINELKKLKKALKDKDEDLTLKIKHNFLTRVLSLSKDETFDDNLIDILNNTGEEGIDYLIKAFEIGMFEKYK